MSKSKLPSKRFICSPEHSIFIFVLAFLSLQMLQVFESHAEVVGYDTFTLCSLPYLKQIAEKVKEKLGPDAVPMVRI